MQVRHDCPIERLVASLASLAPPAAGSSRCPTAAQTAQTAAAAAAETEDALLEAARAALGAQRIVRIAMHCPPVTLFPP